MLRFYGIHLILVDGGNDSRLRCELDSGLPQPLKRAVIDSAFCMFQRIIVPLLATPDPIAGLCLSESDPAYLSDYRVYFDVPIEYGCEHDEMVLKHGVFDESISSRCPELELQALKMLTEKMQQLNHQQSLVSQLSLWLSEIDSLNDAEISDASAFFNISVRSLQLRLSEHNTTFSRIKMQCLIERSKRLLKNPQMSVELVAEKIGFSDATAFRRAFNRVEGMSPTQFRKQRVY